MKIKIVESIKEYNKQINSIHGLKQPEKGIVLTPETFSKVFSPERIKLLKRIRQNKIKNIYQLAKELEKPYEVVFRNVKYLEGLGLIKVIMKDNTRIPQISSKYSIDLFAGDTAMT